VEDRQFEALQSIVGGRGELYIYPKCAWVCSKRELDGDEQHSPLASRRENKVRPSRPTRGRRNRYQLDEGQSHPGMVTSTSPGVLPCHATLGPSRRSREGEEMTAGLSCHVVAVPWPDGDDAASVPC
jgi:hypothetical protein